MLMDSEKKILFPADIAAETGLGMNIVYKLLKSNQIKNTKAGDRFIVSRRNFELWLSGEQSQPKTQ